ncbi:MAG TPA: alkaline phosphatase family protein [Candidatus Cybelea sp.]
MVLIVQENRTFNDFFATFPGADGTTNGKVSKDAACHFKHNKTIPLVESNLVITGHDLSHKYQSYVTAYDGGKMDGFDKALFTDNKPECTWPYQYTDPSQIQPYWDMAQQYTLAEHMFTTQGSSSFVGHQDLIRGGTQIDPTESLANDPSGIPWGCDAPPGTKTGLVTYHGTYEPGKGPFPCTKNFPSSSSYSYQTLRDLLDAKYVSWKYYVPPIKTKIFGRLMNAFDVIAAVRYGPEWQTNISMPQTKIFKDISAGSLPAVSWVIPDYADSDHPGPKTDNGPSWVSSIVNAIGESPYWDSSAIIVVWDDWGGLYDNRAPKQLGFGGLGFRVPALIVSPYAKAGYISKTNYEFGSILKYIEDNWDLGSLGTSDKRAKSIIDCFDYTQRPIPFTAIPSKHDKSYFLHRKPSYLPIDTY